MASDEHPTTGHPVCAQVEALATGVGDLLERPLLSLDAAASREALVALTQLRARVDALTLRVAAHADDVQVGAESAAVSTGAWWATATRQNRSTASTQVHLGVALDQRWHRVAEAFAAGEAHLEQVKVIVRALEDLPTDLDPDLVARAEELLVDYAAVHNPKELKILGSRILETLAPDIAEAHEQARLDAEERRARQRMRLTLTHDGHGQTHGRFHLPTLYGAMLEKALWALASPRHRAALDHDNAGDAGATGDATSVQDQLAATGLARPAPHKLGEAFCELIESLSAADLPQAGGLDATVIVLLDDDKMRTNVGAAVLDTGQKVTTSEVRRMACEARILPIVLDGDSQPLDVGDARRFCTRAQRHALTVRDGGCTAEGCDWPPGMCHAHHDQPWSQGGKTDLANSRLLCPHHHRRIHDPAYETTILPGNKVRFHRRT